MNDEFMSPTVAKWMGIVFGGILLFGGIMTFKMSMDHTNQLNRESTERLYKACTDTLPSPDHPQYVKLLESCNKAFGEQ